jgi:hypothetical protein
MNLETAFSWQEMLSYDSDEKMQHGFWVCLKSFTIYYMPDASVHGWLLRHSRRTKMRLQKLKKFKQSPLLVSINLLLTMYFPLSVSKYQTFIVENGSVGHVVSAANRKLKTCDKFCISSKPVNITLHPALSNLAVYHYIILNPWNRCVVQIIETSSTLPNCILYLSQIQMINYIG